MILAHGTVTEPENLAGLLDGLEAEINRTRASRSLPVSTVVDALDQLGRKLADGVFDPLLAQLEIDGLERHLAQAILTLRRESLEYRLRTELGEGFFSPARTAPPFDQPSLTIRPMPLGTLLHIAAGNADILPALSAAEGLLTGNVNLLKLPQADNGVTVAILRELIAIQPELADFLYVFDTPSTDLDTLRRLAGMADGIVVWGGDEAVSAVRRFAPMGVRLVEWGHKLSFAYLSGRQKTDQELDGLADHILSTRQLLCSSCQVIYLDTDCRDEIGSFCQAFLPRLEAAALRYPPATIGEAAEVTLRRYTHQLEQVAFGRQDNSRTVYSGRRCSLVACEDSELELSDLYGSCLVKPLPRERLFDTLRRHKGYLQTAGLLCPPEDRPALTDLLSRCGLVRITDPAHMSASFCGEAHDGDYPLRRYVRMVNIL